MTIAQVFNTTESPRDLISSRGTQPSPSLRGATGPQIDRTLEMLIKINQGTPADLQDLVDAISASPTIRSEVLDTLLENAMAFSANRWREFLPSLLPFACEPQPLILAVAIIDNTYFKNDPVALTGASAILSEALIKSPNPPPLTERCAVRLLKCASTYQTTDGGINAGIALHLLPYTSAPYTYPEYLRKFAFDWFRANSGMINPWVNILASAPTKENCDSLVEIAKGQVPKISEGWWDRKPDLATTAIVSYGFVEEASESIAAMGNLSPLLFNTVLVGMTLLVTAVTRSAYQYSEDGKFNAERDFERVEGIAGLAAMQACIERAPGGDFGEISTTINTTLTNLSSGLFTRPVIRAAAKIVLSQGPLDPIALWNQAVGPKSEQRRAPEPGIKLPSKPSPLGSD